MNMDSDKAFLSVIIPCYNEEAILSGNLTTIINYLEKKRCKYN